MNNIYTESKDYKDMIVKNEEEDNYTKIERFESMIEESAILTFTFVNDKSIFEYCGVPKCGKLATPKISTVTDEVLKEYKMSRARLLNLFDITNDVYEAISHYPSVKNKVKTDFDKNNFIKALSYFVARHIMIHRCKLGKINNVTVKGLIDDFMEIKNAEKGMYITVHQIANKLRDGKLTPKETIKELQKTLMMRKKELAQKAIAYNGGYLGNATKMMALTESNNELLSFNFSNQENMQLKKAN